MASHPHLTSHYGLVPGRRRINAQHRPLSPSLKDLHITESASDRHARSASSTRPHTCLGPLARVGALCSLLWLGRCSCVFAQDCLTTVTQNSLKAAGHQRPGCAGSSSGEPEIRVLHCLHCTALGNAAAAVAAGSRGAKGSRRKQWPSGRRCLVHALIGWAARCLIFT
jgi:hypothetical protein